MNLQLKSEHEVPENSASAGNFTNNVSYDTEQLIANTAPSAPIVSVEEPVLRAEIETQDEQMSQVVLQEHLDVLRVEAEKKKKQKVRLGIVIGSLIAFFIVLSIVTKGSMHFYFYNFFGIFAGLAAMSKNQKKAIRHVAPKSARTATFRKPPQGYKNKIGRGLVKITED